MFKFAAVLGVLSCELWAPCVAQTTPDGFGLRQKPLRVVAPKETIALTSALWTAGHSMKRDFISFGIELDSIDSVVEPKIDAGMPSGGTVGAFLENVFRQVPNYEYEIVSEHLVSVHPLRAKADPNSPLNLRIARFDVENVPTGWLLAFPSKYIPELHERLHPSTPGKQQIVVYTGIAPLGPQISLHLRDVTIREILIAASIATETAEGEDACPMGWTYRPVTTSGPKGPRWGVFFGLPDDWREGLRPKPAVAR